MAVVSMKQLLESGVHFGHQTRRWNPKMAPYIFTARKDIHIIDLKKTAELIELAYSALYDIVKEGGQVLFVGTKKQAQDAIREEAIRAGQFFVNHRWLGGTLTNFKTIRKRINLLHELYEEAASGIWDKLPKKEVAHKIKTRSKLERFLGGIKELQRLPQAVFVVDPRSEEIAVLEARKLGIPVFAIVDTNCDPDLVDFIIPANDDAIRAIKLITWVMANAVIEAQGGVVEKFEDEDTSIDEVISSDEPKVRKEERPRSDFKKDKLKKQTVKPAVEETPKQAVKVVEEPAKEVVLEAAKVEDIKAPVDLDTLKVAELRELAKEKGLTGYSSMKKAELVDALKEVK